MKYTSLLIDLDNTLLDFNKAEASAVQKVLADNSLPCDDKTVKLYSDINKSFWERFERGEIPKSAIFTGRFKELLSRLGLQGDEKAISDAYCKQLAFGYFTVDGAKEILEKLKAKGYKLYAATNGFSFTQYNRIKGSGLAPYFDKVFISEDAGHQKPEKEYFDYIVENIPEKDRRRMLVIGDSQSSDILGAYNAGIDSCWYNPKSYDGKYPAKYTITNLLQLDEIL